MADQTPQSLDLTPEVINLEVQQGTDVTLEVQLTNGSGAGVDITLDTVKITAKNEFAGTTMIPTITITPGNHTIPLSGKTQFTWTKAQTMTVTPQDLVFWKWEARRVFPSGLEVVYIHGDLILQPSVGVGL
jgi:uncharacterized protein YccT (UPF0319 family)